MIFDVSTCERNIHFSDVWDVSPEVLAPIIHRLEQAHPISNSSNQNLNLPPSVITIVDVRLREEVSGELEPIPGSLHIPLLELIENVDGAQDQLSKDQPVVLVCRNGWRSARAAAYLSQKGFRSVYNLKGGLLLWNEVQQSDFSTPKETPTHVDQSLCESNP